MHREGATVIATDINKRALAALESEGLQTFILNVREPESIVQAVHKTGKIDVLFNCAGFVDNGSIFGMR